MHSQNLDKRKGVDNLDKANDKDDDCVKKNSLKLVENGDSRSSEGSVSGDDKNECDCVDSCLVVDDNSQNIIPMKLMLKQLMKINVDTCASGKQGYEKYEADLKKQCCNRHYYFILMDLQMPVMDGMQATE